MGSDKLLPEVAQLTKDSPQGQRLGEGWERIFMRDYQPHLRPFPQVRALVTRLREAGLKVADITDLLDDTTSRRRGRPVCGRSPCAAAAGVTPIAPGRSRASEPAIRRGAIRRRLRLASL